MSRTYDFTLPHTIPGMYVAVGISRLEAAGEWDGLPKPLQDKLEAGSGLFSSVEITKADLDSIPDPVWAKVDTLLKSAMA